MREGKRAVERALFVWGQSDPEEVFNRRVHLFGDDERAEMPGSNRPRERQLRA